MTRRAEGRLFEWRGVSRRARCVCSSGGVSRREEEASFLSGEACLREEEASFFFKWRGVSSREEDRGKFLRVERRVERRVSTVGFLERPA